MIAIKFSFHAYPLSKEKELKKKKNWDETQSPCYSNVIKARRNVYDVPPSIVSATKGIVFISGLIPIAIANIVYVVRQRQKTRLSAIVKKDIS